MSTVAYSPSDDRVVLLFYKAVVVFPITSRPGEGYLFFLTISVQVIVDEFAAIVGIYPQQGKGQPSPDVLEGVKNPLLGLVFYCLCLTVQPVATSVTSRV